MTDDKTQINFKTSAEDAAAIDQLAALDGYDNRSAWVRFHLRQIINARRSEIISATTLSRPNSSVQVVHVANLRNSDPDPSELHLVA